MGIFIEVSLLYRKYAQGVEQLSVDGFVVFDGFGERYVHNLVVLYTYHYVALPFDECIDGGCSHTAGQYAVVCRR